MAGVRAVMEQQFYLLQGAVEEARRRATEVLEGEQRQALSQAEGIQAHLEQKSQELKKTLARVERLFRNKRDVDFLQVRDWGSGVKLILCTDLGSPPTLTISGKNAKLTQDQRLGPGQL